jgi:predicted DNA-binding protein
MRRISSTSSFNVQSFKQWANITTTTEDAMITRLINSAITKVEDVSNVSLAANVLEVISKGERHDLYLLPISVINSVKDRETGVDVDYTISADKGYIITPDREVIVNYTTTATNDYELTQIVYEYALALYDGQDEELKRILNKINKPIC